MGGVDHAWLEGIIQATDIPLLHHACMHALPFSAGYNRTGIFDPNRRPQPAKVSSDDNDGDTFDVEADMSAGNGDDLFGDAGGNTAENMCIAVAPDAKAEIKAPKPVPVV